MQAQAPHNVQVPSVRVSPSVLQKHHCKILLSISDFYRFQGKKISSLTSSTVVMVNLLMKNAIKWRHWNIYELIRKFIRYHKNMVHLSKIRYISSCLYLRKKRNW